MGKMGFQWQKEEGIKGGNSSMKIIKNPLLT